MNRARSALLFLALPSSCAPTPRPAAPAPAAPCRGAAFDFDRPDPRCLVPRGELAAPPPGALHITTEPSPAVARAGADSPIALLLRNVSGAPLPLELDDSCLVFDAQARGPASSFESECGGLCAQREKKLQVTLEPGGVVRKAVRLHARQVRVEGDGCEERDLGPLPPGRYTLEVILPWTDPSPIPGNAQARASRKFQGPLVVQP